MLATSEEAEEVAWRRGQGAHPRPVVEFGYDMDNEAGSNICAGKWGAATTSTTIRQGSKNGQDDNKRDDGEGNDFDKSEDEGNENNQGSSSNSDKESNNNRYGKRSGGEQLGACHNKRRG